jgi:soluble lytic murein transglycosylase-like protein
MRQLYAESAFSPSVISCKNTSTAGARGIAQFMPTTWPSYGKGDPCKVEDALPAYVKLMSENVRRFPGRLDLAIAAYNSGAWYQYPPKSGKQVYFDALKNKTSFKDLKDKLPKETYEYVSTIMQP